MSITEEMAFDKDGEAVGTTPHKRLYLALIIILVATLSFGLGRLSSQDREAGVRLEYTPELSQTGSAINSTKLAPSNVINTAEVVASSKGTKYHYSYCPGAKQISEKNRITFENSAAAEASGYTLASNCKPR